MIRRATAADADALLALERGVDGAAHWSIAEYVQILRAEEEAAALRRWAWVAEEEEHLLGFIVLKLLRVGDAMQAEVENVAVAVGARRRGVGAALCRTALQAAQAAGARVVELEVRAGNEAALGLYAGLGFERMGSRPGYYTSPAEDAVLLRYECRTGDGQS